MEAIGAAGRGLRHVGETAAGLIESAVQLAANSDAVKWCAYLAADETGGPWRVIHGSGEGAPERGTLLSADRVIELAGQHGGLHEGDRLYFRALPGPAAGAAGIVYAPAERALQGAGPDESDAPEREPEHPHGSAVALLEPLHRLVGHLHALLEHVPGLPHPGIDSLTGLLTETALRERLEEEVARAQRYGGTLSLLVLDVDETVTVEREAEAHLRGNVVDPAVLRVIGASLRESLRQMDSAGRAGGDRVLVLLPETGAEEALRAAQRLGQIVGQAIEAHAAGAGNGTGGVQEGDAPAFELRVGLSTYPLPARSADELLDQAETALRETREQPGAGWARHALARLNEAEAGGFQCVCRRCGRVFQVDDRAHQRARRFCSHTCYVEDRRESERARNEAIRQARAAGGSLREIAQRHGISAERVRQICAAQG